MRKGQRKSIEEEEKEKKMKEMRMRMSNENEYIRDEEIV